MNLQINQLLQLSGHNGSIYSLLQHENALLSAGGDGWIVRWPLDKPDPGQLLAKADAHFYSLCPLPNQGLLAGDMNGGMHWLYPQQPELNKHVAHHQKGTYKLLPVHNQIVSLGGDGKITQWNPYTRQAQQSLYLSNKALRSVAFHADSQTLAIGSSDGHIFILDAQTLALRQTLTRAHSNSVFSLAFSPDGQWLLSGGRDAMLRAWDVADTYSLSWSQPAHLYTINDIAFSPDARLIATASRDKTIKIWQSDNLRLLYVINAIKNKGHINSVNALVWLNAQTLCSASDDRSIRWWQIST